MSPKSYFIFLFFEWCARNVSYYSYTYVRERLLDNKYWRGISWKKNSKLSVAQRALLTFCALSFFQDPVDGKWSSWGSWSSCSAPCSPGGTRSRSRTCTNPAPSHGGQNCKGQSHMTEQCNTQACPGYNMPPLFFRHDSFLCETSFFVQDWHPYKLLIKARKWTHNVVYDDYGHLHLAETSNAPLDGHSRD